MLRMYKCNWCELQQVKDDGSVTRRQQGDRMHTVLVGFCVYGCKKVFEDEDSDKTYIRSNMRPMVKDVNGDWFESDKKIDTSRMRVIPQITWH